MKNSTGVAWQGPIAALLAGLLITSMPAYAAPKTLPAPRRPEEKTMSYDVKLQLHESATLADGLHILFASYSIEQIDASPDDPKAYPAGSGINLQLKLEKAGAKADISFSQLSTGYTSKTVERWQNYELSLGKIEGAGTRQLTVVIHVVEVAGRVSTRADGATASVASGDLGKFQNKSRAQLIELAKELIAARLGKIDFHDYPAMAVWKGAQAYRVEFRAPVILDEVNDRGVPTQSFVDVTVSAAPTVVTPQALIYLYRPSPEVRQLTKLFAPGEVVTLSDRGTAYEARVSRRATAEMSGSSEAYSIDKKTLVKKLLWHEHPAPKISGRLDPLLGASAQWVEITK